MHTNIINIDSQMSQRIEKRQIDVNRLAEYLIKNFHISDLASELAYMLLIQVPRIPITKRQYEAFFIEKEMVCVDTFKFNTEDSVKEFFKSVQKDLSEEPELFKEEK